MWCNFASNQQKYGFLCNLSSFFNHKVLTIYLHAKKNIRGHIILKKRKAQEPSASVVGNFWTACRVAGATAQKKKSTVVAAFCPSTFFQSKNEQDNNGAAVATQTFKLARRYRQERCRADGYKKNFPYWLQHKERFFSVMSTASVGWIHSGFCTTLSPSFLGCTF